MHRIELDVKQGNFPRQVRGTIFVRGITSSTWAYILRYDCCGLYVALIYVKLNDVNSPVIEE